MRILNMLLILPVILLIGSCNQTKNIVPADKNMPPIGDFTITEVTELKIEPNTLSLSMADLDNLVRGHAGCNSFFGGYTHEGNVINFNEFAITEKYCEEPVMKIERAYLRALHETGSYSFRDNILILYSKEDRRVLLKAKKITENN
jgi:heat shock protein HslJ